MVKSKKKQNKKSDFHKVKLKVGKKLLKSNETKPKLRAQKLIVRAQYIEEGNGQDYRDINQILINIYHKEYNIQIKNLNTLYTMIQSLKLNEVEKKMTITNLAKILFSEHKNINNRVYQIIEFYFLNVDVDKRDLDYFYKRRLALETIIVHLCQTTFIKEEMYHSTFIRYLDMLIKYYERYSKILCNSFRKPELKTHVLSQYNEIIKHLYKLLECIHHYLKFPSLKEFLGSNPKKFIEKYRNVFRKKVWQYGIEYDITQSNGSKYRLNQSTSKLPNYVLFIKHLMGLIFQPLIMLNSSELAIGHYKWNDKCKLYMASIVLPGLVCKSSDYIQEFEKSLYICLNYLVILWHNELDIFFKEYVVNHLCNNLVTLDLNLQNTLKNITECMEMYLICANNLKHIKCHDIQNTVKLFLDIAIIEFMDKGSNMRLKSEDNEIHDKVSTLKKVNKFIGLMWQLILLVPDSYDINSTNIEELEITTPMPLRNIDEQNAIAHFCDSQIQQKNIMLDHNLLIDLLDIMLAKNNIDKSVHLLDNLLSALYQYSTLKNKEQLIKNKLCAIQKLNLFIQNLKVLNMNIMNKKSNHKVYSKILEWLSLAAYDTIFDELDHEVPKSMNESQRLYTDATIDAICNMRSIEEEFLKNLFMQIGRTDIDNMLSTNSIDTLLGALLKNITRNTYFSKCKFYHLLYYVMKDFYKHFEGFAIKNIFLDIIKRSISSCVENDTYSFIKNSLHFDIMDINNNSTNILYACYKSINYVEFIKKVNKIT